MIDVDINSDFFALLGMPRRYDLDRTKLDSAYREVVAQVHPDRFAQATDAERRAAMQWTTRINEAYRVLSEPLTRAVYLLELLGRPALFERDTAVNPEFLEEQIEWREALEVARRNRDRDALEDLQTRLNEEMDHVQQRLATLFDRAMNDAAAEEATDCVRRLMFLDKVKQGIDDALFE